METESQIFMGGNVVRFVRKIAEHKKRATPTISICFGNQKESEVNCKDHCLKWLNKDDSGMHTRENILL